jgi:hypothetical protein
VPYLYWNAMLKGQWEGPAVFRKLFARFRSSS